LRKVNPADLPGFILEQEKTRIEQAEQAIASYPAGTPSKPVLHRNKLSPKVGGASTWQSDMA
jgi:hypothetical protein